MRDLFERIRRDGLKIALASSAKEDELHEYKKIAQIDDLIEADTSSADVGRSKPHPDIFEAAVKKLGGIDPDKIVVVGDTPHDAEAAANANMRMIGLLSGGWTEERLRVAEALGSEALLLREPGGTAAGERMRALLKDPGVELDPRLVIGPLASVASNTHVAGRDALH